MRALPLLLAAVALSAGGAARAGPAVTLNGVPIDGVTGQKIENATVVIDDRGDIHITAKGYAVRSDEPAAAAPAPAAGGAPAPAAPVAPAAVTRRYFLATEHAAPGTGFDLAIFINSQWIREVKANEPQVVMEITKYLRPGPNRLVLSATRKGDRPSTSKDVTLRVVVGEGNIGGDHVMIDETLVEAVRTAAEESRSEEFVVQAR
ncbi:MAG: hypothetical protein U0229_00385 [Anaeromyxobacter sp.]